MEAFLRKKDSIVTERTGVHGKSPAKPSTRPANLLFNPQQNRQRTPWPTSTRDENTPGGRQLEGGGGYASSYCKLRVSRLTDQAPTAVSQIFAGLSFYFNGRSGDKQTMHLKGAVSKHGGRTTPFMSMKGVTHVIAENLSASKTDKAMKSFKMKVVHPDWLLRCMAEGKLLPDAPFRVVRSQKLGMDNFFSSGDASSEKEKRREGGKRMLPGTPATGGSKERRRGEGRGRHREKGRPELAAAAATAAAAAATSSSTSNRNVRGRGAPTVGPGTSSSTFCTKGDVGRTCSGRGSGSYSSSSSSCKENGDAVGAAAPPDRGSSNKDSIRHLSEVAQEESGLHSSRSNHATAARKRSRDNPTPSPALKAEGTVRGECHDLIGDDALPSSPSNAHKRQQRPSRHEER